MARYSLACSTCVGLLVPSTAFAHPGHASELIAADSPAHYLLQPEHATVWLVSVAAAMTLFVVRRRRQLTQRMQVAVQTTPGKPQ